MAGQVAVEAARRRPPLHIAALSKRPELDSRPSSTVPYALPRLEELAIDLGRLQRRRDHLKQELPSLLSVRNRRVLFRRHRQAVVAEEGLSRSGAGVAAFRSLL